ncbi:MAG: NAD(P)/FAD-dependent oxidoreductase [Verrucomicrobiota bacterium]|nr:NAD(P)/FAD-dependent oxidoreductase [Verrucomicrobiota bacterium]
MAEKEYDVVIAGGSLAGAASAILLLREHPSLRVLVIEKSERFTRRVGEATVEVSAFFLGRVLGMTQFLNETQLVKQGMRFFFANEQTASLAEASELGGRFQVRLPSYQLDRAVVDEELLRRACEAGAEVMRPASVASVELAPGKMQTVTLRAGEKIRARWVIDASGVAALLARQEGWFRPNTAHPTAAVWARWRGVKDWDGLELAQKFPEWAAAPYGIRGTATNHIVGDGWWSWWIPLRGGDVSVGVVFDQRLVDWPNEGRLADRLKDFLMQHPAGREMIERAEVVDGDTHWRKNLAYSSTTFAGDGFALVGDAAAFLDPLYSPGMDWISFTATATAELIAAERRGELNADLIATHNRVFSRSYARWFDAIYRDKYEYLGQYDLMKIAFLLDLGFYYMGIVSQPFKRGAEALREPPFASPPSVPVYHLMRTYNRRLAAIARDRRRRGALGKMNRMHSTLTPGFTFAAADARPIVKNLAKWAALELREGWRTWFARAESSVEATCVEARPAAP